MVDQSLPVLVTGGSGYIAAHCIHQLLEKGYRVRATVRNLNDDVKVDALRKLHPKAAESEGCLELAQINLLSGEGWDDAVQGVAGILHVASPFPVGNLRVPDDVISPAVKGTEYCLEAAVKAGVSRVVLTSSLAAVKGGHESARYWSGPFTERDWSIPENQVSWYSRSKTLAERRAWEIARQNPGLELVCILPSLVFGPMVNATVGRSSDIIRKILTAEYPAIPPLEYPCVDVRDVARAHILALEGPSQIVSGKRYLLAERTLSFADIARVLKDNFGPGTTLEGQGWKPRQLAIPLALTSILKFFDSELSQVIDEVGKPCPFDASLSKAELGLTEYRSVEAAIVDHVKSMVYLGLIKNRGIPQQELEKAFY